MFGGDSNVFLFLQYVRRPIFLRDSVCREGRKFSLMCSIELHSVVGDARFFHVILLLIPSA